MKSIVEDMTAAAELQKFQEFVDAIIKSEGQKEVYKDMKERNISKCGQGPVSDAPVSIKSAIRLKGCQTGWCSHGLTTTS